MTPRISIDMEASANSIKAREDTAIDEMAVQMFDLTWGFRPRLPSLSHLPSQPINRDEVRSSGGSAVNQRRNGSPSPCSAAVHMKWFLLGERGQGASNREVNNE